MKRIVCLVIAFALVFSNLSFFGETASAENIEAKNAAAAYFEVIKANSEYVNTALTQMGSGYYHSELEIPNVNLWVFSQMRREDFENVCYALCDISNDGVPELMIAERFDDNDYMSVGFFGYANNTLVNFDENTNIRNKYIITENNLVKNAGSSGAMDYGFTYYTLPQNSTTFKVAEEYRGIDGEHYCIKTDKKHLFQLKNIWKAAQNTRINGLNGIR